MIDLPSGQRALRPRLIAAVAVPSGLRTGGDETPRTSRIGGGEPLFAGDERNRVLVTILFADIVEAAQTAAILGDHRWHNLLARHHAAVRRELARFGGREIDVAGDGVLAAFRAPARALHCAAAIRDGVEDLGIRIRAGVHAGECEVLGDKLSGIALRIVRRVAAAASPGEILMSSTVRELLTGSDLRFEPRASHELQGVPGEWALVALRESHADGLAPAAAGI